MKIAQKDLKDSGTPILAFHIAQREGDAQDVDAIDADLEPRVVIGDLLQLNHELFSMALQPLRQVDVVSFSGQAELMRTLLLRRRGPLISVVAVVD